ncbi:hypothetical protein ACOSQ2_022493 [Xanthoceras sorbifolium]
MKDVGGVKETEKHCKEFEATQKKIKDLEDERASIVELTKKLIEKVNMCRDNVKELEKIPEENKAKYKGIIQALKGQVS